ncbi:type I-E CRISPR-associated protein Cse1/CasA [Lactobacillus agrestimuris]|uniref:type I-E CRISPR-associated protein Cse1/CasA n=1 Tax=Lactobacillus agrestimuris TaxID=2941328 RepID=UPI002043D7A0|nr:type I-E CRISPR-associated protein Cse1/CasA [Lactobacillus agrestimuris]
MNKETFNLIDDPWIKAINIKNQTEKVSLEILLKNSKQYRQLAGDTVSQDLAVLRFLIAILTTVYCRYDYNGFLYPWISENTSGWQGLEIDDSISSKKVKSHFMETFQNLYKSNHFSDILFQYLEKYHDNFDLFGDHPFYQVTTKVYDNWVADSKKVSKGKGTVAIKQINRLISESNNSPSVFSPKTGSNKNEIKLDELVRWIISYQNYTGTTDKTKIEIGEKFSASSGWLYGLNPIYIKGKNLFETLMLNLKLITKTSQNDNHLVMEKPIWEFQDMNDYIEKAGEASVPDNIAELYTVWSRILHIEWDENNQPTIFSACLPKISSANALIEPMTTWRKDKKTSDLLPATRRKETLDKAMWRNFGQYVETEPTDDNADMTPGIVEWANTLKEYKVIPVDYHLNLVNVGLVSDGNATSQSPYAEFYDYMKIEAGVLFDESKNKRKWPKVIEDIVEETQKVAANYRFFVEGIGKLRNINNPKEFANRIVGKFYERLNEPFLDWLDSLTVSDDRQLKQREWKKTLKRKLMQEVDFVMAEASSAEILGKNIDPKKKDDRSNIFTLYNVLMRNIHKYFNFDKGGKNE